jgi:hypothetical protein
MAEGTLADELEGALRQVANLAERHRAAQAHETTIARLEYLHDLLRRLAEELSALRREAEAHDAACGDGAGAAAWQAAQQELRAREPASLRAPAHELVTGDLGLLRLVEYVGAASTLAHERRVALRSLAVAAHRRGGG